MRLKYIKQAGTFGPLLQVSPCYAMTVGMRKAFGRKLCFSQMYLYYSQGYGACYYLYKEAKKVGDWYLNQYLRESGFLQREYKSWLADLKKMERMGPKPSDNKGFAKFYELFINLWARSIVCEVYDEDVESRMAKLNKDYHLGLKAKELIALISPKQISIQLQFEKDLLQGLRSGAGIKRVAGQYYFLDVDYLTAIPLSLEKRLEEIKRRGLEKERERVEKLISNIKKEYSQKQEVKSKLAKEVRGVIDFFSLLVEWRDLRKKMHQAGSFYIWRYIFTHLKIPEDLRPYLVVQDYLNKEYLKQDFKQTLKQRKKHCLISLDCAGKFGWFLEKREIENKIEQLEKKEGTADQLKGTPASWGTAKGRAKVINSAKDFPKMQKGDILIAPMTRPEYLPVMKLASAVLTDEGGITSHAAIVSRELNIPCIIGLKIATKVLKDGDIIAINASHGSIKIIKH